jgi:hypothetical protein
MRTSTFLSEEDANKLNRVLLGLRALATGQSSAKGRRRLPPDEDKLNAVVADLATRLMSGNQVDADELEAALERDGFRLIGQELTPVRSRDEPADRIASHVDELFGSRPAMAVARNHYEQANRAFDRGDWEAANAQFRSACDAVYDALAHSHGCAAGKTGGHARKWLEANGLLDDDEARLLQAFMGFAGRAGSHAGLSGATDSQLRRHFASALIAFGIAKLEE